MPATARPSKALPAPSRALARFPTEPPCRKRCRRAPRATHSIARCGISRPSRAGRSAAALAGIGPLRPLETCYTLSLATADEMAAAARAVPQLKLLKLKLGGAGDPERMRAVRHARPDARLVADANEAWNADAARPVPRRSGGGRNRADRATAAGRRRRSARRHPTSRPRVRRRERSHQRRHRRARRRATTPSTSSWTRPAV